MAILIAAGLFGSQVGKRTLDYLRYDTNVGIEVVYTSELKFPAVTICNQNPFRWVANDGILSWFLLALSSLRPWIDVFALPEKFIMAVTEVRNMSISFYWLCEMWAEHAGM